MYTCMCMCMHMCMYMLYMDMYQHPLCVHLSSGTVQYCQCDAFSLTESTQTLEWTSRQSCDAVVLSGVLRSNSVLKTLNLDARGDLDDYCREEIGNAILSNSKGKLGYSDIYGLKDGGSPQHTINMKDKEQIRSKRSFTLFCGLLRSNVTLTSLSIVSLVAEHVELLAQALATNLVLQDLRLEAPPKSGTDVAIATLPVQQLNGSLGAASIDLSLAGGAKNDGSQAMHRFACAVVGEVLSRNASVQWLKLNPGTGSEGGAILHHIHRARKSSLHTLDLTGIGLGDRGGAIFFEALLDGKCKFLSALHLGHNELTDVAVGNLLVEVMRDPTCNLATLDLKANMLGTPVIAQAVKQNLSLTSLDISGNPIDGARALTLRTCRSHPHKRLCRPERSTARRR